MVNPSDVEDPLCVPTGCAGSIAGHGILVSLEDWFDKYILPLPPEAQIMTGWNEAGEDRHHWGSVWWDEYRKRCRQFWPFRYWLHWELPISLAVWKRRLITEPMWWVRHRLPPHRYHILPTGLPPGYYDPDIRFLH